MLDFDSFTSALNLKHKLGGITRRSAEISRLARIGYFNSVDTEEHVMGSPIQSGLFLRRS